MTNGGTIVGFWDRLMGREEQPVQRTPQPQRAPSDDEVAIERYRYLLRTAPAATIEEVHEEAFTKLTPQQRAMLFRELGENAAPGEAPVSDDPRALARSATRSELRSPGTMERAFSAGAASSPGGAAGSAAPGAQGYAGPSFGSMLGSSLLGTVAGYVIASTLMSAFLPPMGYTDAGADSNTDGAQNDGSGQDNDSGSDTSGGDDWSASADPGTDFGGDSGSDFGGGDFGGGDFGGF